MHVVMYCVDGVSLGKKVLAEGPQQEKDVIEWALKHKEELGLRYVQNSFIEKYQAIPELKELIFKELNKEGGIK